MLLSLYRWAHDQTTHRGCAATSQSQTFRTVSNLGSPLRDFKKGHFIPSEGHTALPNKVNLFSSCIPVSYGCPWWSFVCRVLPGDIPVCSCCWNSTLGLPRFVFKSSNGCDSGVLTFSWIKGASCTQHLWECSANNVWLLNNEGRPWPPGICQFWGKGIILISFREKHI